MLIYDFYHFYYGLSQKTGHCAERVVAVLKCRNSRWILKFFEAKENAGLRFIV